MSFGIKRLSATSCLSPHRTCIWTPDRWGSIKEAFRLRGLQGGLSLGLVRCRPLLSMARCLLGAACGVNLIGRCRTQRRRPRKSAKYLPRWSACSCQWGSAGSARSVMWQRFNDSQPTGVGRSEPESVNAGPKSSAWRRWSRREGRNRPPARLDHTGHPENLATASWIFSWAATIADRACSANSSASFKRAYAFSSVSDDRPSTCDAN
jgi:hypothetical protein